jgi:hypothetical protein
VKTVSDIQLETSLILSTLVTTTVRVGVMSYLEPVKGTVEEVPVEAV